MSEKSLSYHVIDFPPDRLDMPGINELNSRKHFMYRLLEMDVTVARRFIEDYRARTGELLSFTGYLAFCLARAVEKNKVVQTYMKGDEQLVVIDDVDVGLSRTEDWRKARLDGSCHPGRQPQDLSGDPPGNPLGSVQSGAAEWRDALIGAISPAATAADQEPVKTRKED